TTKNKKLHPERVEYKKYCRFDQKHTVHKQTR
ncbi:MAG: 50S ribosomal protein L33, partial [Gammaproteobacteria bacterium]